MAHYRVIEPVRHSEKLRERYFGELDGQSDSRYVEVWNRDRVDAQHSEFGVETTVNVVRRTIVLLFHATKRKSD